MEPFLLPASVILSGSGNEDGDATVCLSVRGERRLGVSCKDVDSVIVQVLPCSVPLEAVEKGGSAGIERP